MTFEEAQTIYLEHIDGPYSSEFCAVVGRFQEGFLADGVTDDLHEAFVRGVDSAVRLLPVIKIKAQAT